MEWVCGRGVYDMIRFVFQADCSVEKGPEWRRHGTFTESSLIGDRCKIRDLEGTDRSESYLGDKIGRT